jgi:KaiC/GvpD/RAD55 family RecA-like ATPase/5S rRNA maturation endonuclease (ribonuclease M5)
MSLETSKAFRYVQQKGWTHRATDTQIQVEICPVGGCDGWHFYLSFDKEKDGLWNCFKCGEKGNLYQLMSFLGDRMDNVTSIQDVANSSRTPDPLPNIEACHAALIAEAEDDSVENSTLDYLLVERGFSMATIEKYKLGLEKDYGKRWLVIPYFHKGNLVYAKFRTVPPDAKEFRGLTGRESPLFNQECLVPNMDELLMVEGEFDAISCLNQGITSVVGLPGANMKKRAWLQRVDDMNPKAVYLLYDRDKVGQAAAKEMAKAIGLHKVRNILLPEFTYTDSNGEEKQGKDINEWFRAGHTVEELEELKAQSKQFNVDGVQPAAEVIGEIQERLAGGETLKPKWYTQWPSLNSKIGGFEEGDLVGIMAEAKCGKTTMAMNVLDFLNVEFYESVMMFCQEMQPRRLVTKWMACVTDTDEDKITLETTYQALHIAASRKADYLFAYTRSSTRKEVFDTIRQTVRRYGVKFVCFDNLQILCRNIEHSAQEANVISKEFKQLAMELGIVIFLIIQPHRVKEGEIVAARNAFGTSAIEKDVDCMICLHRNREGRVKAEDFATIGFLDVQENFSPDLLVRADLTRYAPGGVTTLRMIGERSKVVEYTPAEIVDKGRLMPANDQIERLQTQQYYEAA